jgi:choline dehydrogenase-like flavoprotein
MTNAATPVEKFDALVLGSGEAGKYLSWSLGAEGKRVALVERRYVGGRAPISPVCRARTWCIPPRWPGTRGG